MGPENWQTICQVVTALGLIMTALGGYGSYHFGKKIDSEGTGKPSSQIHTGSGDNVGRDKYEYHYYSDGEKHESSSEVNRPFISCGKQVEIKNNSLIFHFKNVGDVQAENVRIRTFEILRKSPDLEDYDKFVLDNTDKSKVGPLYGVIPPNETGNVAWTLAPNEKTGKVHLDTNAIFVLQIDYTYDKNKPKRFLAFYGHMNFHGREVINLKRQIEVDGFITPAH